MSQLLAYTEFLTLCGDKADILGVSYDDLVKALHLSRRTLYNEKSASGWRVKKVIGSAVYFEPQDVYEWYVAYTVHRQRKMAA